MVQCLTGVMVGFRVVGVVIIPAGRGRIIGQLHIGACLNHLLAEHKYARVRVIGDDCAVEAPLGAQDAGNQRIAAAGPGCTDAVEGRHNAHSCRNRGFCVLIAAVRLLLDIVQRDIVQLHAHLEGLQVNFAGRLLIQPGCCTVLAFTVAAVVFLVIEGKMLDVGIQSLGGSTIYLLGGYRAGQERIFGIILAVTAAERRAVNVHRGRIPAVAAADNRLIANHRAVFQCQVLVPGLCQRHHIGEHSAGTAVNQAAGSICINHKGLADAVDGRHAVAGAGNDVIVVLCRQLVEQVIPHRVVIALAAQVNQAQTILGAVGNGIAVGVPYRRVAGICRIQLRHQRSIRSLFVLIGSRVAVCIGAVDFVAPGADDVTGLAVRLGEGPGPVAAGQVNSIALGSVQLVGDGRARAAVRCVGRGIGLGIGGGVHSREGGIAVRCHAIGCGLALGSQHIVDSLMGVLGCGDVVIPCIQNVRLCAVGVIRLELILGERDAHGLTGAGGKLCGFAVANQLHGGLLHAVCLVIVGVGALHIHLHNVLAGNVAGVRHRNLCGAGIAAPISLEVTPVKAGVAQAVAEGIDDLLGIVVIARVALAENGVLVAGFIVAIADVDAFLVGDIVVLGDIAVLIIVGIVAKVLCGRGCGGIGGKGVHRAAAGADLAGQNVCHAGTNRGGIQHRLDVGIVCQPVQLQRCVRVDNQHGIIIVVVQVLQDFTLGGVRLQIAANLILLRVCVVVHGARHIAALACHTLQHIDRGRALHAVQQAALALQNGQRALIDAEVLGIAEADGAAGQTVACTGTRAVEVP